MSAALTTDVDKRLLRTTKFPPEFNKKVDTTKVKSEVITTWAAGELKRILGDVDEILSLLVSGFILDNRYPNIKELQISLTGFLDKEAPGFCQHLWNLLLSAQDSETGVPKELLEAKKTELINERIEEARQREEAQKRQDAERERERNMAQTPFALHEPFAIPRPKPAETQTQKHARPLALPTAQKTLQQLAISRARRQPSQSETTTNDELKRRGSEPHDQPAKRPRNSSSVGIEDTIPTNSGAEYKEEFGFSFHHAAAMDPERWWNINLPGKPFPLRQDQLFSGSGRNIIYGTAAPAAGRRESAAPKSRELFPGPRGGTILSSMQTHRLGSESHQAANQQTGAILPSQSASMTRSMRSVVQHAAPAPDPMPASPDKLEQPLMERKMQEKKKKFITQRDSGWYPSLSKRKDSFNDPGTFVSADTYFRRA
ncbi:hypothetical protein KC340_g10704 [Hortaea werneckii]|nr:hypothetical protein KC342_g9904 [Hortaea werneckii]KAI7094266.1 hypothetical protein KC339_g11695 [Hortaea werneckii]KAI7233048.1 hypothetical protein KC365_g6537 [Hortaea werneckii]KAI7309626.1 hypothetical protein KC340_g10704 [Hortaea werneckii]